MSQLKTNSITNIGNTGDANIVLGSTGDTQIQSLNSGPLSGFRNQLINGDFRIAQRGSNITTSGSLEYTLDRWMTSNNTQIIRGGAWGATKELPYTARLQSDSGQSYIRQGIELARADRGLVGDYYLSWYTTAAADESFVTVQYVDEMLSLTNAQPITTGTVTEIEPADADGYRRLGCTVDMDSNTPDLVNLGNKALSVGIRTTLADYWLTGIQLESGSVATPFEFRFTEVELSLCQRYYYFAVIGGKFGAQIGRPGSGSKQLFLDYQPPVNLRTYTDATVTLSDAKIYSNATDTATSTSGISSRNAGVTQSRAFRLGVNYGSGSNQSNAYGWRVLAKIDAEL